MYKIANDAKFNTIVVPTIDTIRNEWLIEKLLTKGYHVMCTGRGGVTVRVGVRVRVDQGLSCLVYK
jgi:dynein heavy chain